MIYELGPVHTPSADVFDDFDDEQGQNLLGSLHLEAEEEPVRRGASRANSVRFDVSAIHGSNWASAGSRSSGEFGPVRPNSGFGSHPIERSSSHKSDGRHSSAGHSVHSGRTSSLGLDTNFLVVDQDDGSPIDIPEPPPGLFVLGSVPAIIRCWLNDSFSHSGLLYADVCTGSQKSTIEFSLVKELGLADTLHKTNNGLALLRLPVYLPEAIVNHPSSRTNSPAPQLPTLTATFEVTGMGRLHSDKKRSIRIFIGSDTLRAHNADILFSQNVMMLYGDDRNKLTIPFVRPEDDSVFKSISTTNAVTDRVELKATAVPFQPGEVRVEPYHNEAVIAYSGTDIARGAEVSLPSTKPSLSNSETMAVVGVHSDIDAELNVTDPELTARANEDVADGQSGEEKHDSSGIWGSWRSGGGVSSSDTDATKEALHRSSRGSSRSMKVLKPSGKTSTGRSASAARTGSSYEPPASRNSAESRRKAQAALNDSSGLLRWESKRPPIEEKPGKEAKLVPNVSKSTNPIGGASAFAWMNSSRSKSSTIAGD